jgi:hypothetical protein
MRRRRRRRGRSLEAAHFQGMLALIDEQLLVEELGN